MKACLLLSLAAPAVGFIAQPFSQNGKIVSTSYLDSLDSMTESSTMNDYATGASPDSMLTSPVKSSRTAVASPGRNTPVSKVNQKDPFDTDGESEQVQGGSLKTWTFADPRVQRAQVVMRTMGRPLNSKIELWQGPDNSPYKLDVYLEDGDLRPFKAMIELPGSSNTIAVRNEGHLDFPIEAKVEPGPLNGKSMMEVGKGRVVQGGAVYTTPFEPNVQSVKLILQTDGRPMNARIELMQGPYNDKQVMEIYTEDGFERPFICVIETPGVGNVVRIVNTATVEFPLKASVDPFKVDSD